MSNGALRARWLDPMKLPVCAAAVALACGGPEVRPLPRTPTAPEPPSAEAAARVVPVPSGLVARVPGGTFGPHIASSASHRVAVWAVPEGDAAGWYSLAFPKEGSAGARVRVADVAPGLSLVRVNSDGTGGVLVLTSRRVGERTIVEGMQLGAEGVLRGGPHVLGETPADILWLDSMPTARGSVVLWAERAKGAADLYAVSVGPTGVEGTPTRHVRGAAAWQMVPFGEGPVLVSIERGANHRDVVARLIDDEGKQRGNDRKLATGVVTGLDLEVAPRGDRVVVAYSEEREFDQRLVFAELDQSGAIVQKPRPATAPRGDQTLVSLVGTADSKTAYLAWEEPWGRGLDERRILVGRLASPEAVVTPEIELDVMGADPLLPTLRATPRGLVAVTTAPQCATSGDCASAPVGPVFLEFDESLGVRGAGPIESSGEPGVPADLAWDVFCDDGTCRALTARATSPASVYLRELAVREAALPPARPLGAEALPRVRTERALGEVLELSALSGVQNGDRELLSWVSYFDSSLPYERPKTPAPDGRYAPVRAVLRTQAIGGNPPKIDTESTLSWRARSLGGVELVPGHAGEHLVVWSALDNGKPQIFATVVNARGGKLRQRMITKSDGEVSDVAAVRAGAGWAIAWIDARGDSPEVYVTLLDDALAEKAPERRITERAVSPTGVQLAVVGDSVVVAWSDARGASQEGYGDIYSATLSKIDLQTVVEPRRLAATPPHSHSPRLVARGEGALLAWVEAPPSPDEGTGSIAVVELDSSGRFAAPPASVDFEGRPLGLDANCDASRCRVVATVDVGQRAELWGFGFERGHATAPRRLVVIDGAPASVVAPVLFGETAYYAEADATDGWLLRRLEIDWK